MGNRLAALLVCLGLLSCTAEEILTGAAVISAPAAAFALDRGERDREHERRVFLQSTEALHPAVVATAPVFVADWLDQAEKLGLRSTVSAIIASKKAEYETVQSAVKAAMEADEQPGAYDAPHFERPIRVIKSRPRAVNPPKRKKSRCIALHGCEER